MPGKPVVNVEKALGRVTVRALDVPVILKPEQDLVNESQVQRAPLPRGDPLADFASHVSERFAAIARTEPYRRMHNMYRLFLIGRVMNADRQRPYDLHFWLTEYAVRPNPTEREIAAIKPKTVTHNCWGRPYAPSEFNAATIERQLWGGVLIGYSSSGEAAQGHDQLEGDLGANLGVDTVTSLTSRPRWSCLRYTCHHSSSAGT